LLKEESQIFDRIKNDFERLRKADPTLQVFGASQHCYQSTAVSSSFIDKFEQDLGVELPGNYREFLSQVGYGCGPYYGLWSPSEILLEVEWWAPDSDQYKSYSPSGKFPLQSVDDQIQCEDWPNNGCIPIGHQGCTYWTVLVLEGVFSGTVWDVACFEGFDGEWFPARRPVGLLKDLNSTHTNLPRLDSPPDFLEWIESWIERCKLDLSIR
jgi:hypothetical protein